jgi:hypothetical protein
MSRRSDRRFGRYALVLAKKIEREEERRGREKTDNWLLEKNKQNEKNMAEGE